MPVRFITTLNRYWAERPLSIKALALLLIPLPILIAAAGAISHAHQNEQQARVLVERAQQVCNHIQGTLIRLLDAEASARQLRAAREPSALAHYSEASGTLRSFVDQLAGLVADNPVQSRRASEIRRIIEDETAAESARYQNRGSSSAIDGEHARVKLTEMQTEEERLLEALARNAASARWHLLTVLIEIAIVGLFFQMIAGLMLSGTISGQIRALQRNARLFGLGLPGGGVHPDTSELKKLAHELGQAAVRLAHSERALRESEKRFRMLFKEAPIAYHEIDREGVVRHVNAAECAMLGRQASDIVGQYAWDLVSSRSREVVRRSILNRLAGACPTTPYECDVDCRDQSWLTVEVHENLICDSRGVVTGMRSALLDVTATKMVDTALRRFEQHAQELNVKNDELLGELETAREASATKGRFLAAMSHELRTPLNGIIGLSELVFDGVAGPVSEEQQEYLGDVLASSKHLLELVNDVLDLAKVESGKIEFVRQFVKIEPLLREVCDVLRILSDEKRISVALDTANLDTVFTDPARLKQVVYNYLSNAIKFTPPGGTIQVRARGEGDRAFRVEVQDNGPGIEEGDISRLFVDFQQLEQPCTRLGTGLGLALTKRMVESQGGAVGVRSHPGKGSVFFAVLPTEPAATGSTPTAPTQPEAAGVDANLPRQTIPV
jgi:PAS domain S-box-containing protein